MDAEWRYCLVCGYPLERIVFADGREGWAHARALVGGGREDHVAVPEPVFGAGAAVTYRCDICDREPVTHQVDAADFQYPPPIDKHKSCGGWGLCRDCAPAMRRALARFDAAALVERALTKPGVPCDRAYRNWLRSLILTLLRNVTSEVQPFDSERP